MKVTGNGGLSPCFSLQVLAHTSLRALRFNQVYDLGFVQTGHSCIN